MSKDKPQCNSKCCRSPLALHYVSFTLLYLPLGVTWYWGDIVVYLTSYWYIRLEYSSLPTPWLLSIYITTWSIAFILASFLLRKIDQRIMTTIGVLLFDAGLFLSYFSAQHSIEATNFTIGFLTGAGFGVIQAEVFTRIAQLVSGKVGIIFAMLDNCYNVGAVILNLAITWYVNTNNVEAKLWVGMTKVFNDKHIIDRVPSLFLLLGIMTSICHIPGLVLSLILLPTTVSNRCGSSNSDKNSLTIGKNEHTACIRKINDEDQTENDINFSCGTKEVILASNSMAEYESCKMVNESSSRDAKLLSNDYSGRHKNSNENQRERSGITAADESTVPEATSSWIDARDLGPWEALRTLKFYILWFTIFATDATYIVLFNFYKVFGQLWISDDHFLTNLAIVSIGVVLLTRLFWGILIDKLTVKNMHVVFTTCVSLSFFIYYFTPQISRWLYAGWTILLFTLCAAVYLNFPVVTMKLFGRSHFGSNYGLIATATIVLNLGAPLVLKNVIQDLGWSAVLIMTGALNAMALLANIFAMPDRP